HELSRLLGDREQLVIAATGLAQHHMLRGRLRKGLEIGKEVLTLCHDSNDPSRLANAYFGIAMPSFWLGDLQVAREFLEKTLALENRLVRNDIIVTNLISGTLQYLAWTLWYMGYPDQGLAVALRALAIARERKHAFSLASALSQI